ncbi:hypothetical protein [Campylobacter rectus]|uniref:hypothetical protein n=1 Tax=Campylobacter rectus TaxID=203 RepID=UPI000F5FD6FC|nr:hypothetical protein [Campylobacter rectus]RRD54859.1 hypothetical protein EII16_03860 [Campylobacter rectus]
MSLNLKFASNLTAEFTKNRKNKSQTHVKNKSNFALITAFRNHKSNFKLHIGKKFIVTNELAVKTKPNLAPIFL